MLAEDVGHLCRVRETQAQLSAYNAQSADWFGRVKPTRRIAARGFTLIELLVVIAIVAVLASMLLPALDGARRGARRINCLNNMRQLNITSQMYGGDFDSYPPSTLVRRESDYIALISDYYYIEPAGVGGTGLLYKYDYLSQIEPFYCPGRTGQTRYGRNDPHNGWETGVFGQGRVVSSYVTAGAHFDMSGVPNLAPHDMSKWHRFGMSPPDMVYSFEVVKVDRNTDLGLGPTATGHGLGHNMTFYDGSARFVADPENLMEDPAPGIYGLPLKHVDSFAHSHRRHWNPPRDLPGYIHKTLLGWSNQKFREAFPD